MQPAYSLVVLPWQFKTGGDHVMFLWLSHDMKLAGHSWRSRIAGLTSNLFLFVRKRQKFSYVIQCLRSHFLGALSTNEHVSTSWCLSRYRNWTARSFRSCWRCHRPTSAFSTSYVGSRLWAAYFRSNEERNWFTRNGGRGNFSIVYWQWLWRDIQLTSLK